MTAKRNKSLHVLTAQQSQAIPLVLAGQSDQAVAQEVGVHRVTVNRWRNHHPAFIAQMNRERLAAQDAARERLTALMDRAIDHLFKAFEDDSNTAAGLSWRVIEALLLSTRRPELPVRSEEVVLRLAEAEKRWPIDRILDDMKPATTSADIDRVEDRLKSLLDEA